MLKNILSKFRKPEDPIETDLSVRDLEVGSVFEFDLRTFEVREAFEYDWGNNSFSSEFKVSDGSETFFLAVEEDDELELSLMQKLKIRQVQDNLPEYIHQHEKPPTTIRYQGTTFLYEEESPGYFRNTKDDRNSDDSWSEFISWDYYSDEGNQLLSIEQWGEDSFEATVGRSLKEREISNILPSPK